jgi:hypothetical protein
MQNNVVSLSAPALTTIGGDVTISSNGALESLDFPALTTVGGNLTIYQNAVLCSCDVIALVDQINVSGDTDTSANDTTCQPC